jgi:L-amino acid N-acyltransferase
MVPSRMLRGFRGGTDGEAFLIIRPAYETDLEAILAIYNDAVRNTTATFDLEPRTPEQQAAWFDEHVPPHVVLVAEDDGAVIAWASLSPFATRPAYRFAAEASVYVDRDARRRGVGEALVRQLMALGRLFGLHELVGRITEENEASIRMVEKLGFRRTGLLEEVGYKFDRWLNVAVYQYRCGE